ncbi:RPM1-interacting protein 4-like [Tasmannia lanceolata]|uniref:RPM1-interacting protein 4-like n=1 Tax=Tasmannia lanceolata TaxID=3420 RepID=UPI004064792E
MTCIWLVQQHPHVPKFGNWEGENVPYTMYLENARKDKGVGTKMINPNDTEKNPDAFQCPTPSREYSIRKEHNIEDPNVDENHHSVRAPPPWVRFEKDTHLVQHHHKKYPSKEEAGFRSYSAINAMNPQKSRNNKSSKSFSDSEKSNSDRSLLKSHRHPARYGLTKNSDSSTCSTTPLPPAMKHGYFLSQPVPKFGTWDETDPKSDEGFTTIFNKVKEEKKIGAANLTKLPTDPAMYSNGHRNHDNSSSK